MFHLWLIALVLFARDSAVQCEQDDVTVNPWLIETFVDVNLPDETVLHTEVRLPCCVSIESFVNAFW